MALGLGDGAEIRTPMAITVISGLVSSTAADAVVIPSDLRALVERVARQRLSAPTSCTERRTDAEEPGTG